MGFYKVFIVAVAVAVVVIVVVSLLKLRPSRLLADSPDRCFAVSDASPFPDLIVSRSSCYSRFKIDVSRRQLLSLAVGPTTLLFSVLALPMNPGK